MSDGWDDFSVAVKSAITRVGFKDSNDEITLEYDLKAMGAGITIWNAAIESGKRIIE